jgi:NAD(P)H-dependent FMN reductase
MFDEDLEAEEGKTPEAKKLKELFVNSDGFIFASPEYNSGVTAALKNAIDWVSRADSDDEKPLLAFKGKTAVIIAASPSDGGGVRSLAQLRTLLLNIRVEVLTGEVSVPKAYEAFKDDGSLADETKQTALAELTKELVEALS